MKKLISLLLVLALSLAACGTAEPTEPTLGENQVLDVSPRNTCG